ncbi:hypothetical protein [Haladaptatus sp. DJG-WS-42]|uniref:hypothetical protein n=1 Tax=Haladaptatus sp. DJG-WS-42 TaxID=3120516 RepID=UPI0030CC71F3
MVGQLGGRQQRRMNQGRSPLASSERRNRAQAEAKLVTLNQLMVAAGIWLLSVGMFVALFSPALWLTGIFGLTLPALPSATRWAVTRARARNTNDRGRRTKSSLRLRIHKWLRARLTNSSGRDRL